MQKSFYTKIRQNALSCINVLVSLYKGVERKGFVTLKADKRLAFFRKRATLFCCFLYESGSYDYIKLYRVKISLGKFHMDSCKRLFPYQLFFYLTFFIKFLLTFLLLFLTAKRIVFQNLQFFLFIYSFILPSYTFFISLIKYTFSRSCLFSFLGNSAVYSSTNPSTTKTVSL